MTRLLALLLAVALLAGCSTTGPGVECDPCAQAEASSGATAAAPFAQAAAASASGGQRASNQPTMTDPGARGVFTPVSRGAGSQTANQTTHEQRSQAGAPSVNLGLVLPTEASASAGGGVSPVVASLQSYIDDLRASLKLALMDPTTPQGRVQELMAAINTAVGQMAQAQASTQGAVTNHYHFTGARIVQSVANGSSAGDSPTTAIDPDAARAVGQPLSEATRAVMAGEPPPEPVPAPDSPSPSPSPSGEGQ